MSEAPRFKDRLWTSSQCRVAMAPAMYKTGFDSPEGTNRRRIRQSAKVVTEATDTHREMPARAL